MRLSRLSLLLPLLLAPARLPAQSDLDILERTQMGTLSSLGAQRGPKLDPKRIINESNGFLREREPEMNAEEYALYEKVVNMLSSNPSFALRLLEGMMNESEEPSPAFEFILGNAYYAAGDYAKTEERYKHAVERYPTFLRAWNNLGVLYYSTDRFPDAVRAFSRSVALVDRDPTTWAARLQPGEGEQPHRGGGRLHAGALRRSRQRGLAGGLAAHLRPEPAAGPREAIARTLIKTKPEEARFWLVLANVLLTAQRKQEAMVALELCAGVGIAGPEELTLLGDLYAEQGLHAEALAIYTKLVKPEPAAGEHKLLRLAQSHAAEGRTADARAALQALPAGISAEGQVTRLLVQAQLARTAERWDEARRDLEQILAVQPMHAQALLLLGTVHTGAKDDARAAFVFETALRIPEAAYRASLELANLELRARNYAASAAHLQRALGLEHTDEVADYLARVRTMIDAPEPAAP